ANVMVPNGGTQTCTITNDDQPAHLTLVKVVINNNGGNAQASEWTLNATGDGGFSGKGTQDAMENKATLGPNDVKANIAYQLGENGPSGYTAGSWACTGGVQGSQNHSQSLSGNISLYLPLITTANRPQSGAQKGGVAAA